MLDVNTYLITERNATGPIIREANTFPCDQEHEVGDLAPGSLSSGQAVGTLLSLGLIAMLGIYLAIAI